MALVVFTGGARSGKSAAATHLALIRSLEGSRVVVAVFGEAAGDTEMAARIARHQGDRPASFDVLEAVDGASWRFDVSGDAVLLVDCLGTLVSRIMASGELNRPAESVEDEVQEVVSWLVDRAGDTIIVTNEVGDGVVPSYASGRVFRDVLGRANRVLVSASDAAYLVVAGRLVDLAILPQSPSWPED